MKDKYEEEELDEYENELLMNSRLAVMHSKWYPIILFAAFASIFYFAYGSFIFGILWLMLAWISVKRKSRYHKKIIEDSYNNEKEEE